MGEPVVPQAGRMIVQGLLIFIATHFAYLFKPPGYRIVDSDVSESFGNALVVLESDTLRLRFTRDKSQLLMEFQPIDGRKNEWFSQGLLKGLLTGDRGGSEVLTPEWAGFLEEGLPELALRLAEPESRDTAVGGLRQQARLRAKELFG